MRDDLTVVYFTSNQEDEGFESRIQQNLLKTIGDTPLISVSQVPIDFGFNVCVGDVGVSSQNAFRQLQIGAREADTKFICPAEADYLYPKEYFEFRPPREDIAYTAHPLYVVFAQRGKGKVFCEKPRGSEAAMVIGRQCLIDTLEFMLKDVGTWGLADANDFPWFFRVTRRERFLLDIPLITFKTDRNMHRRTPHDPQSKTRELPYWGNSRELVTKYL